MGAATIDLQLREQSVTEAVLWQHALYGVIDESFGVLFAQLGNRNILLAPFPAGIRHVLLVSFLLACQEDLFSVDHDDKIAGVEEWRENGFVLAAQDIGYFSGQTAQYLAFGIYHVPLAFVQINFRNMRLHSRPTKEREIYHGDRRSQQSFWHRNNTFTILVLALRLQSNAAISLL